MRRAAVCLLAYLAVASAEDAAKTADCSNEKKQLAAVEKEVAQAKSAASKSEEKQKSLQAELTAEKKKVEDAKKETAKLRESLTQLENANKNEKSKAQAETAKLAEQIKSLTAEKQTASAALQAEKKQTAQLKDDLGKAKTPIQKKEHSVTGLFTTMASLPRGLTQHLLDQTTMDETVIAAASGPAAKAKDYTVSTLYTTSASIRNIDYAAHYKSFVAPHVGAAGDVLYTNLRPHLESTGALDAATSAYSTVKDTVAPHLLKVGGMAYEHTAHAFAAAPSLLSRGRAALEQLLEGIFKLFARVSPDQAEALPKDFYDRIFLLVLCVVVLLNLYVFTKWAWWLTKLVLRFKKFIMKMFLKPIFKLIRFTLGCVCCMGTCCYCCGLCRKKGSKANGGKAPAAAAKTNGVHKKASAAQVTMLLQKSKDKGKLNDGVKTLVKTVKNEEQLKAPPDMKGMMVTKETLKEALKKFKEVDVKTLGL